MILWVFLQIYKNIFNNVSPSGFFIITAVPRSLTSAKSVDSVGEPTHPNHLCRSVKSVGEYQYSHGIHGTFLLRRTISTHKQYKAFVNITTHQHYNLLFLDKKKGRHESLAPASQRIMLH